MKTDCGICYRTICKRLFETFPCNHQICKQCLKRLKKVEDQPRCPFCRRPIEEQEEQDEIVIIIDEEVVRRHILRQVFQFTAFFGLTGFWISFIADSTPGVLVTLGFEALMFYGIRNTRET